jgi:RNA polymerase-binding transcription factor DksA
MTRVDDRRQAAAAHRRMLMERLSELTNRAARIDGDLRQLHSSDWIERATEVENDDVLEHLDSAVREEVEQVNAALRRIDEGLFGICAVCESPIEAARLDALPATVMCARCATRRRQAV